MSQTSQALNNLSRTLMDRMRLVGDREQRLADMELRRNQLEYDLSRNRAADERAQFEFEARKPGLEAQRTRDAAEYGRLSAPFRYNSQGLERENSAEFNPGLRDSMVGMNQQPTMLARSPEDKLNTPVGIGQIAGSLGSVGHFISTQPGAPKETALVYKLGREVFDAAPIGGYYVRKDGTKVTQADFEANKQKIISLFDLETDVQKRYNEQSLKLMDVLNNPNVTPEQAAKIKEQIAIISDPAFRIQQLIQQRNRVKRYADTFGGEIVGEKLAKIDKDIAAAEKDIQASVKEDKDRAWDREKLRTEEAGRNRRTEIQQSETFYDKDGNARKFKPTEEIPSGYVSERVYDRILAEKGDAERNKAGGKTIKPEAALKRISEIQVLKAKFDNGSPIDSLMSALLKEQGIDVNLGTKVTPELRDAAFKALDKESAYLEQFVPKPENDPLGIR